MIKYQGLSTLEVLKEAKNYNKWIADSILAHVTPPALEIGAGTGNLTTYFLHKHPLFVTDCDKGLVKDLENKFKKNKHITTQVVDITKKPPKQFTSFFSTVFAINVLEHIENDTVALKNINTILKKKGKLVLLVPAKKRAYSKLDKQLGHFRRYEKKELFDKLEENGYKVEKLYYFNIVGLVSWYVRDKVKRNNINLKPYHIKTFDMIVPFLRVIESKITMPIGISLIAVARKV
ncbi:MAG TPA: class I SAM-dependent methyltransferase [Candidatus Saccharimonadales bacterium]|nr:class I SAM-dependent methyltransferase [Candidatus Saccharimonadales bacterium]